MSIAILYTDLRNLPSRLERHTVEWQPNLTAFNVLEYGLGLSLARAIEADLGANSREIMVSWWNKETDEICEIGGVGRLDWAIADQTVLTVNYQSEATTQQQIDESLDWTSKQ